MIKEFPDVVMKVVDVDENGQATAKAGIRYLPTVKVFKEGAENDS